MSTMDNLIRTVLAFIESEAGIQDATYTSAFAYERLPNPLTRPRVAVGFEEVRMSAGALGQVLSGDAYGSCADVVLKVKVYMPEEMGGDALNEVFSRICGVLLGSGRSLGVQAVSCGEVRYESSAMAYTLSCRAELRTYVGEYDDERPLDDIVIKEREE